MDNIKIVVGCNTRHLLVYCFNVVSVICIFFILLYLYIVLDHILQMENVTPKGTIEVTERGTVNPVKRHRKKKLPSAVARSRQRY